MGARKASSLQKLRGGLCFFEGIFLLKKSFKKGGVYNAPMNYFIHTLDGDRAREIAQSARLLKQAELARALGIAENTLRGWKDCPRLYIGKSSSGKARRVRYDLDEVRAWLKEARSC